VVFLSLFLLLHESGLFLVPRPPSLSQDSSNPTDFSSFGNRLLTGPRLFSGINTLVAVLSLFLWIQFFDVRRKLFFGRFFSFSEGQPLLIFIIPSIWMAILFEGSTLHVSFLLSRSVEKGYDVFLSVCLQDLRLVRPFPDAHDLIPPRSHPGVLAQTFS